MEATKGIAAPGANGTRPEVKSSQLNSTSTRETRLLESFAVGQSFDEETGLEALKNPFIPSTANHLRRQHGLNVLQHADGYYFVDMSGQAHAARILRQLCGRAA